VLLDAKEREWVMCELEMFNKDPGLVTGAVILFITVLGILGNADMEEEISQQEFYCENVAIWIDSNGENGHPNFRGVDCEAVL